MSTCPDLDLFSVYLDNELPEQYKETLESHLAECEKCREKFNRMKAVHEALSNDSANIVISENALEDSFAKLQARRSYNRYVKNTNKRNDIFLRRVLPAMAAALVIALVLPLRLLGGNDQTQQASFSSFASIPGIMQQASATRNKGLILQSVSAPAASGDYAVQNALYNADLTSALQSQILASIDIFGSDLSTNKIQITIDLSNVSGITPSDREGMKIIQIPAALSSEGQQ